MGPAMSDIIISIANDFSRYPAGRTRRDGEYSAERFREELLVPGLQKAVAGGVRLVVKLDGVFGYSSSFLEEAFGGLVRRHLFKPAEIERSLVIAADNPIYASVAKDARQYLHEEMERIAA